MLFSLCHYCLQITAKENRLVLKLFQKSSMRKQLPKKFQNPVLNFYPFSNSRAPALKGKKNNAPHLTIESQCVEQSMYLGTSNSSYRRRSPALHSFVCNTNGLILSETKLHMFVDHFRFQGTEELRHKPKKSRSTEIRCIFSKLSNINANY